MSEYDRHHGSCGGTRLPRSVQDKGSAVKTQLILTRQEAVRQSADTPLSADLRREVVGKPELPATEDFQPRQSELGHFRFYSSFW